jgi:hypothetical protein
MYLAVGFNLEGSSVNKAQMLQAAQQKGIPVQITSHLEYILSACETGQFTEVTPAEDRLLLLASAKEIISSIEEFLL